MAFQVRVLTNARPVKNMPDIRTTSTNGNIQINPDTLKAMGLGVGSAIQIVESQALANVDSTFSDSTDVFILIPGVASNPKVGQKAIGAMVSNIANKMVLSTQNVWQKLRGNNDETNKFDLSDKFDGVVELADGSFTAWKQGEAVDGTLYIPVHATTDGKVVTDIDWVEAEAGDVTNSVGFHALTFVGSEPKMERKSSEGKETPVKATKKATVANPADLDEF